MLSFALAVLLVLSLAGCTNNGSGVKAGSPPGRKPRKISRRPGKTHPLKRKGLRSRLRQSPLRQTRYSETVTLNP